MQGLFELITNFIEITGNQTADTIILFIIGIISFLFAFGIIGMIFDALGFYDSDIMSDCHWIVRLIVFIALSIVCIWVAKFIKWLCGFQWWVYLIAGIILTIIIVSVFVIKYRISKNKSNQIVVKEERNNVETENIEKESVVIDRDHCPRCGGLLVKRHGPYGNFYGCQNFSTKNCRYTRRFK